MASSLATRLRAARHAQYVGRSAELELFRSVLNQAGLPFSVLYVFGPGGVGKTALLSEFALVCDQAGCPVISVDSRNLEPSPDSFLGALRVAMGLAQTEDPLHALARQTTRHVLLLDTSEVLAPLDRWMLDEFLPHLPDHVVVVFAGRNPPSLAWRADPGWQTLVRVLPLRNLSTGESLAYLLRRRVPANQHEAITQFTHGHPLALSLVADTCAQRENFQFQPEAAPDVVKLLLERLVQQIPSAAHRRALEACAIVRLTTEGLLSELLAMPDAHELFEWLRGLSFIEWGPSGLFPHDLTREALAADLRWRNPDWYAELHKRARTSYRAHLQQTSGQEQQRLLFDYIFLHRDNLLIRPFFEWQESGATLVDVARETDRPAIVAMVAKHEGRSPPAW